MMKQPTAGEKRMSRLLAELPEGHYYTAAEPRLFDHNGRDHTPDFIVICREYGLLVIEVKDWVDLRGGNRDEIYIMRRDGTPSTEANPLDIANDYAYQLVQQCMRRGELTRRYQNKTRLAFPWQIMVVLPNISAELIKEYERVGIWSGRVVMGKETLQNSRRLEQAIRNLPWRWEMPERMDDSTFNIIRGVVNPQLVITDAAGNDLGTQTLEQEKLIREPLHVLEAAVATASDEAEDSQSGEALSVEAKKAVRDMQVRLVRGTAGSGKTLVLANRAEFLAKHYPDQRLLVITFNRDLADVLVERLSQSGVEVRTFNEICYTILYSAGRWAPPIEVTGWLEVNARKEVATSGLSQEYVRQEIRWRKEMNLYDDNRYLLADRKGRKRPLSREKRMLINRIFNRYITYQNGLRMQNKPWQDWNDLHLSAVEEIQSGRHKLREWYDIILIDEAQDFAPSWFTLIQKLIKPTGELFICDDPTQSIYQAYSWLEKGIDVRGRTRILRVPFRCTRAITRAAYSLIEADPLLNRSDEIIAPDLDSDELIEGEKPQLVAFQTQEQEITYLEEAIDLLVESGVNPRSIAVLCHSRRSLKNWERLQKRHKQVFVAHYERMKGLDFDIVFLPHLNYVFKSISDPSAISEARRRVYVGMTRARDRLVLSYCDALPDALTPLDGLVQS